MIPTHDQKDKKRKIFMTYNLLKSTTSAFKRRLPNQTRRQGSTCSIIATCTWSNCSGMKSFLKRSTLPSSLNTRSLLVCSRYLVPSFSSLWYPFVSRAGNRKINWIRGKIRGKLRIMEVMWHLKEPSGNWITKSQRRSKARPTSEKWTKIAKSTCHF